VFEKAGPGACTLHTRAAMHSTHGSAGVEGCGHQMLRSLSDAQ
jgi:hypothetical protein